MTFRRSDSPAAAAAKAAYSTASAYRFEDAPPLPSQTVSPRARRRPDPLAGLFETEVVPLLEARRVASCVPAIPGQ